jgi:hypothetical protein
MIKKVIVFLVIISMAICGVLLLNRLFSRPVIKNQPIETQQPISKKSEPKKSTLSKKSIQAPKKANQPCGNKGYMVKSGKSTYLK